MDSGMQFVIIMFAVIFAVFVFGTLLVRKGIAWKVSNEQRGRASTVYRRESESSRTGDSW